MPEVVEQDDPRLPFARWLFNNGSTTRHFWQFMQ
jgi:hypothetical protein